MNLSRQEIKRRKRYKKYRKHRNRHPNDNNPINLAKTPTKTPDSFNPMATHSEGIDGAEYYKKLKEQEERAPKFIKKKDVQSNENN